LDANEIALTGELTAVEPLRYTPAGIPLLGFKLMHRSRQTEAGLKRQVECEMGGIAMAEVAVAMARWKPGQAVKVSGFLNRKNRMSAQLILHATEARVIKD
jgi:primosomal replication protein N